MSELLCNDNHLPKKFENGQFRRESSFYRLCRAIRWPPYGTDGGCPSGKYFVETFAMDYRVYAKVIDPEVFAVFQSYHWPRQNREKRTTSSNDSYLW